MWASARSQGPARREPGFAVTVPDIGTLIVRLVRVDRVVRRDAIRVAAARRHQLIQAALLRARLELLANRSARAAAREIDDAIRGRRGGSPDRVLRAAIVGLLSNQLGYLDDLPREARIRQLIEK